ncbi:outer membrane lipoprotein-sorting protein [Rhodocytophaga rosea]|uniref:Outer membrane lipoprotein-sorting protein n=1 Tax=Rhodocytophaga rosea TaxID=2704465 RepID=A0A6C0GSU4_9BACT|nr:outer membrane lipoprotein-sorting protein [Rhodocytophaga rosea]QHT70522.1 outer membrane lipoprotein-sorting protein [Rhodocytophaga rosea]
MPIFIVYLILILNFQKPLPTKITSAETLVEAMQKRYSGKWAKTITFVQYNTHYTNDTISGTSIWYEAIAYPDKFRIDFGMPSEGNAVIFANDSVYNFKTGQLKASHRQPNNLMLLAGGIYFLPKTEALQRLKDAGYDIKTFHENTWQGKPAFVVGATKGDLQKPQFWIDKDNLFLVRTLTPTPDHHLQEAQFSKHIKSAGGWIETEVLFLKDGKKEQLEEYKELKSNPSLPDGLFDPAYFGKVHWMK